MKKFLIIQTAFIGDVILATALIEKLHRHFPDAKIDFLLRKGNEVLLENNPIVNEILIWEKKKGKIRNLFKLAKKIRQTKYDVVVNCHRHWSSGFVTFRSKAKERLGFDKNPFSRFFTKKTVHIIGNGKHEVERNQELIAHLTSAEAAKPKLYISNKNKEKTKQYKTENYICIAPASVWFTKQYPIKKWVELINKTPGKYTIYLLGSKSDIKLCEKIKELSIDKKIEILAGKLSLMDTAALMKDAKMNYVNDSGPMHIASAVNAPTTAIFCSTVPKFGFYPLADNSQIAETSLNIKCRPCGVHGLKICPKKHFICANSINIEPFVLD